MSIDICKELSQNFIDFSYEANSARAFPDVRDGLKPGQRACLWEMFSKGYSSNKPHVKSAKISGGTAATWWPHGTTAIYETFTRMSQDWINNIPEVDWHGANGNIVISAQPAADRYTEARLSKATEDGMLYGIKKNNVPMILNFSEDETWPEVLPAIFPRLLINGCQGIGVTIANYWETNNLTEIVKAIEKYISTNTIDYNSIYPDFPSGGIIINKHDIHEIYETGKGKIVLRGKAEISDNTITITELPYQIYVEPFINEIKTLIEKDELNGIDEIYNKTDDDGLKIEIVCSKSPDRILRLLYKNTSLQKVYAPNHMALLGKTPKMFTLKDYFDVYIKHNINCIVNEYNYDLKQAKERYNIVCGLISALDKVDDIIALIKKSKSSVEAQTDLVSAFGFNEAQAKAIVDMRLGRLANLELIELKTEKDNLETQITTYEKVLSSDKELNNIFLLRLKDFEKKYGFKRKTKIEQYDDSKDIEIIDDVEPEKCVVIMTESGYIKRIKGDTFKPGKKGTKGIKTQDDITSSVIRTNTVDNLLVFSNQGKVYRLPVNEIPEGTSTSKGMAIKLLTSMEANENASIIYSIYKETKADYIAFITKNGIIKKSKLSEYLALKKTKGMSAINLKADDAIVSALLLKEEQIVLITKKGKMLWCESSKINAVGKTASGVRGMKVDKNDEVISAVAIRDITDKLAIFTTTGYGKRVPMEEFGIHSHGGKGQMCHKITKNSGDIAGIQMVADEDLVLIAGDKSSLCIEAKVLPIVHKTSLGSIIIKDTNVNDVSKV